MPRYKSGSGRAGKLDRLEWAAGLAFLSYGSRIGVRVTDPALLERLPPHLPPRRKPLAAPLVDYLFSIQTVGNAARPADRPSYRLYAGPRLVARAADLDELLGQLGSNMDFTVAVAARRWLFVHAGVVGWRGRAIVIPGRSMSGKSRLVAALVRAGATYYSDEFAVFDDQGRVHPYPRPLSLRSDDGKRARRCPVQELGGRAGSRPLPVRLLAVTEYVPGARWRPCRLSSAEAVLALLSHTVLARYRPDFALSTLHRAVSGAVALRGKRSGAEEMAGPLLDQLAEVSTSMPSCPEEQ